MRGRTTAPPQMVVVIEIFIAKDEAMRGCVRSGEPAQITVQIISNPSSVLAVRNGGDTTAPIVLRIKRGVGVT